MAWLIWDKMCLPKDEGGLGFRDLKAFNLTLLAKQGWQLQTNTTSLVHRVFKAWYFPKGNFLSIKLENHPSYAWQSIIAAQPIIQRGHHWQVGNGHSLQIWRDKWLTQPSTFTLTSRPLTVPYDAKVSILINPHTRAWRTNMVSQFFSPMDVAIILSIPLSYQLPYDRMVWAFAPKGNFTVQSIYRLALDMVNSTANVEASDNHQRSLFWKTL